MSDLILTRATLRREAPIASLASLVVPTDTGGQADAAHRLVWALFSDGATRKRDFLWRQEEPGAFLALSRRPANPLNDIFEIESKIFAPELKVGDRLQFRLHANPVIARKAAGAVRGIRHDVVMDALHHLPTGQTRADARGDAVVTAGRAWLLRQGTTHGFEPEDDVVVDGYQALRIARQGGKPLRFGVLDIEGVLRVTKPHSFLAAIESGFGRARAFGCGLMLIKRAR